VLWKFFFLVIRYFPLIPTVKKFLNRPTFAKVTVKSKSDPFFWLTMYKYKYLKTHNSENLFTSNKWLFHDDINHELAYFCFWHTMYTCICIVCLFLNNSQWYTVCPSVLCQLHLLPVFMQIRNYAHVPWVLRQMVYRTFCLSSDDGWKNIRTTVRFFHIFWVTFSALSWHCLLGGTGFFYELQMLLLSLNQQRQSTDAFLLFPVVYRYFST